MAKFLAYTLFTAFVIGQIRALTLQDAKKAATQLWSTTMSSISWNNEPHESRSFICITNGVFPDPENCSYYVHCSNGKAHYIACPENMHYSVRTQQCDSKCEAYCDTSMACQCSWSSCASAMILPIPPVTSSPRISREFSCAMDGVYRNPKNCTTFIHCSNGTPYIKDCPRNLHFNEETNRCDYPCSAKCDHSLACRCKWSSCNSDICYLPPKMGSCQAHFQKWFYDRRTSQCRKFVYGGCDGNENNFDTQEECERHCEHIDVCYMPRMEGSCEGYYPRYYFHPYEGRCLKFIYSGCQGNKNNFATKMACEKKCIRREDDTEPPTTEAQPLEIEDRPKPDCSSPAEIGPCRASIPRFYYDTKSGDCKRFTYGGCGGNGNNYISKRQCYSRCKPKTSETEPLVTGRNLEYNSELDCSSAPETGPCIAAIPRFYYDAETGGCKIFTYGGCGGNGNNYVTERQCLSRCKPQRNMRSEEPIIRCIEEGTYPDPYNCSNSIICYSNDTNIVVPCSTGQHYNLALKRCTAPCDAYCDPSIACQCNWPTCGPWKSERNICRLEKDRGSCHAALPMYFFNFRTGQCEKFLYGGCEGNENKFLTLQECEQTCNRRSDALPLVTESQLPITEESMGEWPEPDCSSKPEKGPCRGSFSRYYYDEEEGECKTFIYGGCKGNRNNYATESQCIKSCKSEETEPPATEEYMKDWPETDCLSLPEKGPCRGRFSRYYFDEEEGDCKTFIYGGCGGNRNNYATEKQCKRTCRSEESEPLVTEKSLEEIYESACFKRPEKGPCRANIPRFYYDKTSRKCKRFIYGGCGGNENNYKSEEQCLQTCFPSPDSRFTCPESYGRYAIPYHCKFYYLCAEYTPIVFKCPADQAFDARRRECVPLSQSDCNAE